MSLQVFDTRTGAKIDPWKENQRLRRDLEMARNALHDAYDKIVAYHKAAGGEYQGGVPNQVLLPQIRMILGLDKSTGDGGSP